jgi:hypothetical protein
VILEAAAMLPPEFIRTRMALMPSKERHAADALPNPQRNLFRSIKNAILAMIFAKNRKKSQ